MDSSSILIKNIFYLLINNTLNPGRLENQYTKTVLCIKLRGTFLY